MFIYVKTVFQNSFWRQGIESHDRTFLLCLAIDSDPIFYLIFCLTHCSFFNSTHFLLTKKTPCNSNMNDLGFLSFSTEMTRLLRLQVKLHSSCLTHSQLQIAFNSKNCGSLYFVTDFPVKFIKKRLCRLLLVQNQKTQFRICKNSGPKNSKNSVPNLSKTKIFRNFLPKIMKKCLKNLKFSETQFQNRKNLVPKSQKLSFPENHDSQMAWTAHKKSLVYDCNVLFRFK